MRESGSDDMKIKPLRRSITTATIIFAALLVAAVAFSTYQLFTNAMFDRYEKQMESIVSFVQSNIDDDDLAECAKTYKESKKHKELQAFLDNMVDNYDDLHYIYAMQILDPSHKTRVIELCTGNSTYEKEHDPDMLLYLGDGEDDWFTEEMEDKLWNIQKGDKDVYLFQDSTWGTDYTLARPLIDSKGNHYALLCVDVGIDDINKGLKTIYIDIAVIAGIIILFIVFLLLWMRRNVTKPINQLKESVTDFAEQSSGRKEPGELNYKAPKLEVRNEVRTLSDSVTKLSESMKGYIKDKLTAESEKKDYQEQAYKDALTNVRNRTAYQKKAEALTKEIAKGSAQFSIVMVDVNGLKTVNDRYGHERGNELIIGVCDMICQIFKRSPVFRVGGDEFVAVLQRNDYMNRQQLVEDLRQAFRESEGAEGLDPWKRYSAAVGIAVYEDGDTVEEVFSRADQEMYKAKAEMKAARQ